MVRSTRVISVLALLVTLAACSAPAPAGPPDTTADIAAIGTLRSNFAAALASGDVSKVMALYTSDAINMVENEPAKTGAAISEYYTKLFEANTAKVTITAEETKVSGDLAYDRGQFMFELTPKAKGAATMTEHGKYIVILNKQADGSWKVAREIGNANMMMAPPPAPAKK